MARLFPIALGIAACTAFASGCSDSPAKERLAAAPAKERLAAAPAKERLAAAPAAKNSPPTKHPSKANRIGILLAGDRASSAFSAIHDYSANDTTTPEEISENPSGTSFDRTNLSVAITLSATVGEVNDLLTSIDGRIVDMLDGVAILLVKIPDPRDFAGLEKVASQVKASPIVRRVTLAAMGSPDIYD